MQTQFLSVVTRKGQITIPAEIRNALGIKEGDRVALVVENEHQVCLTRSESVVARTAGMFKTDQKPLPAEELRRAAEDAIADSVAERDR